MTVTRKPCRRWLVLIAAVAWQSLSASNLMPNLEPLAVIDMEPVPAKLAALGERLFHDTRLSRDNSISCASCHPVSNAGMDGLRVPTGISGQQGVTNAPTVLNAALNSTQFWDGRTDTLEEQITFPIHNPLEMDSNWQQVLEKLSADAELVALFRESLDSPVTVEGIKLAIASFERTLPGEGSRFDQYLGGDTSAISLDEQEGYRLFKDYGCSSCHQGRGVGGNMFERMGIVNDYFSERGNITEADWGRFNVTGHEEDRYEFKVPSLRNVALTAPYFHDGSADSLEAAVDTMAYYQLGRKILARDRQLIVAFLKTLTRTDLEKKQ